MLRVLTKNDYGNVRPLFEPLTEYLTFCAAVIESKEPGRIYVDDVQQPNTAFMTTRGPWAYLAGDPSNASFNRALNKAIFERRVVDNDASLLLLHCYPESWEQELAVVCHPRQPNVSVRRHYVCRKFTYDWRAKVPAGITIEWADTSLLQQPELNLPQDVKNVLEKRGAHGNPMESGFGFVAFYDGKIVAYAVIDCIVGGVGEIGLYTTDEFRLRGLATTTSAAAIEHGLSADLVAVVWDCSETNTGSVRTAEKLGLKHERNHKMYVVVFDKLGHLVNTAWHRIGAGLYNDTLTVFEQIVALDRDPPAHAYFPAACACAGLGDRAKAIEYLTAAVDRGWSEVSEAETQNELKILQKTAEWPALIERMEANRKSVA